MKIINGKEISEKIREEISNEIKKNNLNPTLAIIMVGDNPASEIYVRNKMKACEKLGINAILKKYNEDESEDTIIKVVQELNNDKTVDGIMIQSPLPKHLNEDKLLNLIVSEKDVDGFGINSLGHLASNDPTFISATPYGIIKMLEYENIDVSGKNVVIIGRSKIVGRPLALALLNKDATVTITHSKTKNLSDFTKQADILIVAIGKANFIKAEDIKQDAVIIDVGINRIDGKIYGDVDFESASSKASYITPVPGGVGPMTITMLLYNVVKSAEKREEN